MKKFYLLTKTLLCAILLCAGATNAWGDETTTITYDFTSFTSQTLTKGTTSVSCAKTCYYPSVLTDELGSRFVFQYNAGNYWLVGSSYGGLKWNRTGGNSGSDDYFAILNLKAGDIVTITTTSGTIFFPVANQVSGVHYANSTYAKGDKTETNGNNTQWAAIKSGAAYTVLADGRVDFQAKRGSWTSVTGDLTNADKSNVIISSITIQTTATETMTAPTITSEATDGGYNVTITSGSSSIYSGVTTYYTTDGSDPTTSSTKYTGTFLQASTATIKAITVSNSSAATSSDVTSKYIDLDVESVTAPTIGSPVYAGANRTVTITSGTSSKDNTVTTYYTTDGTDPTSSSSEYTEAITITEDCTVKAISISSTSVASSISSQAVTVGKLTLNAPTFTKTGYSDGSYTVTIADDQSSLEYVPASTTIKYRIGTSGDYSTYSAAVSVEAGKTLYAYVEADNYTTSSEASKATGVQPTFTTDWSLDFTSGSVSYATTTFDGYYNLLNGSSEALNTNFGVSATENNGGNSWYIHNNGLYCYYSGARSFALQNLTVGQFVRITTDTAPNSYTSYLTLQDEISYQHVYTFEVTTAGTSWIKLPRNTHLYSVEVLNPAESVTVTSAGFATYVSANNLDYTSTDIKAYTVNVASQGVATLTQINKVQAGVPVLLYKDGGTTEAIPVCDDYDTPGTNNLVAGTGATVATTDGDYTNMILNNVDDKIGFYFANNKIVAANRAYLQIASTLAPDAESGARGMRMVFAGDITGINEAEATAEAAQKDGKFIENGKLVIVKNGKKYNANGAQVK